MVYPLLVVVALATVGIAASSCSLPRLDTPSVIVNTVQIAELHKPFTMEFVVTTNNTQPLETACISLNRVRTSDKGPIGSYREPLLYNRPYQITMTRENQAYNQNTDDVPLLKDTGKYIPFTPTQFMVLQLAFENVTVDDLGVYRIMYINAMKEGAYPAPLPSLRGFFYLKQIPGTSSTTTKQAKEKEPRLG